MAKFTPADIARITERLKRARDRGHPAHFLIGAGCSISAGIPGANDLIKKIHQDYAAQCAGLNEARRHAYGACMALLSINERRDLIRPFLEAAKINWGTIVLAQLIAEGFVERVLTVNFDLVLENACGLLGVRPAVYDFGVAPASDPAMVVSPAIIHLHGQSYGLVLLNTDDETQKHREKLRPILVDTLRNAPLVVVGYSGSADGISQNLLDEFGGREPLYWIDYDDELKTHLHGFLGKDHFHFLGGADFDRFMIELAQSLACWPPRLFRDPFGHLLEELRPVVAYPVGESDISIDFLGRLRQRLESLRHRMDKQEDRTSSLQELYMKGDFEGAANLFLSWKDPSATPGEARQIAYWSLLNWAYSLYQSAQTIGAEKWASLLTMAREKLEIALRIKPNGYEALNNWGNLLLEQGKRAGGEEAVQLFRESGEKYAASLAIKPDQHEALNNWGNLLLEQAKRASGEEAERLFRESGEKYAASLAIKPDKHEVLNNWGTLLLEQSKRASGEEAEWLFREAGEKYAASLAIKPDKHEALNNWGNLLLEQARRASDEKAVPLFHEAGKKYAASLAIKPDKHEVLNNWGSLLLEQAKRSGGEEAERLFREAGKKFAASLAIKPDKHQALNNWGNLLLERAKRASGGNRKRLMVEAEEKLVSATKLAPGETYNLACLATTRGNEARCRLNLEIAEKYGTLPSHQHLETDKDLDPMRDKPWFRELVRRLKGKG
jgi:Tfp pilus assembly protein PilF